MPVHLRATVINKWKHPLLFLFVLLLCSHLVSTLDLRTHICTEVCAASFLFLSDPGFGDKLPNLPTSSFQLSPSNLNLSMLTYSFLLAKIKIPKRSPQIFKPAFRLELSLFQCMKPGSLMLPRPYEEMDKSVLKVRRKMFKCGNSFQWVGKAHFRLSEYPGWISFLILL